MSLPPVSYFDSPPVIPQTAMLARDVSSPSRYPRRTGGTSAGYSSIIGNYGTSERNGSTDYDMRQGSSGPPGWSPMRNNPSPILEELQPMSFFSGDDRPRRPGRRDGPGG